MQLPFDAEQLDKLMEDAGLDALIVTSKHNIQYLLGGYVYFFHASGDAIGVSRYLPMLIYPAGHPEKAAYIGHGQENYEHQNGRFWMDTVHTTSWGTIDATDLAIKHLKAMGLSIRNIGVEFSFLPADAAKLLEASLPESSFKEAHFPLERLRAKKTPLELERVKLASEKVVDSMLATFGATKAGMTKNQIVGVLQTQELSRGLRFEYCLTSAGTSLNRAPSDQVLKQGDIFSLDSGGRFEGYIGDLCRMGILGEPDSELVALMAEVEEIQQAARTKIRPGATGVDIYSSVKGLTGKSVHRDYLHFVAHGVGIVGHEAPRLSGNTPLRYNGYDAELPLEAGMVLSVETTIEHPQKGLVKIEDTLAVTDSGFESYGDHGRGWNIIG